MKVLLTGCSGQLGKALIYSKPKNIGLICPSRKELDLADFDSCFNIVIKNKPDWIINAGAFTNVDQAEINRELTLAVNSNCLVAFCKALKITGGKLMQISTDYVFDGEEKKPYKVNQKKSPINFYGYSKALAEDHILNFFGDQKKYLIIRTSWVLSATGNNFLKKIISLHAENKKIRVISDQFGSITSTSTLANACWKSILYFSKDEYNHKRNSILHFTDQGETSWYELAKVIGRIALDQGILLKSAFVEPITSNEYKSIAKRPKYSVLDCSQTYKDLNLKPINWITSIEDIIKKIK